MELGRRQVVELDGGRCGILGHGPEHPRAADESSSKAGDRGRITQNA
jgi:hypothetical protein